MSAALHQSTITALWQRVRSLFDRLTSTVGTPAAIVALSFTSDHARRVILRQVTRLEIYVRKLLLAEAVLLTPTQRRGPRLITIPLRVTALNKSARRHAPRHHAETNVARPETWRVTFGLALPRDAGTVPESSAPRIRSLWVTTTAAAPMPAQTQPRRLRPIALRIARRIEALRRVLNDPSPHVRRLARTSLLLTVRDAAAIRHYAFTAPRHACIDHHDPRLNVDIHRAGWIACDTS